MAQMNAAVVTSFDEPPHYQQCEVPQPTTPDEMLVDVLAVGLHPRTRSGAAGAHYTSTGTLPMVPGIDGVGRRPDGKRIYFVARDDVIGTMADKALIDTRRAIELPDDVDVAKVAAAMNPAMSAWVALRRRVPIESDQSVLVLGATGNAGAMAVQVAKRLGAGRVIGAGRDLDRLNGLTSVGADDVVQFTADIDATGAALGRVAADVDIVIDYLWGKPAPSRSHPTRCPCTMSRASGPRQTCQASEPYSCPSPFQPPQSRRSSNHARLINRGESGHATPQDHDHPWRHPQTSPRLSIRLRTPPSSLSAFAAEAGGIA